MQHLGGDGAGGYDDGPQAPPDDDGMVDLGTMMDAFEDAEGDAQVLEEVRARARAFVRKQQPLYLVEAERIVLGSIFRDPVKTLDKLEDLGLRASDFYVVMHQTVFAAMMGLHEVRRHVDVVSVCDALNRRAKLEEVGGAATLAELEGIIPSAAAAGYHAGLVIEKARLRAVATAAREACERAALGHSPDDVTDQLEAALTAAQTQRSSAEFSNLSSAIRTAMAKLPVMGAEPEGISTGFVDVDKFFRFVPGDFVIVAARPSMGKTQFVLDSVRETAIRKRNPACLFSLEMSDEQLMKRLLGSCSGLNLRRNEMPSHEIERLSKVAGAIAGAPLEVDDTPSMTIGYIRARARQAHRKRPLSTVIIDYIQMIDSPESTGNVSADVGKISRGLKTLARELKCTVIALSQLNRGVESRNDKRPVMSDLRVSGNLEQDADVIALLFREDYYLKDKTPVDRMGVTELIIGKNRNGPTGVVELAFDQEIPRFSNRAKEWQR